jgi:hypothetical protein
MRPRLPAIGVIADKGGFLARDGLSAFDPQRTMSVRRNTYAVPVL